MLFGRQDAADWITLQINSNNRVLLLSAFPLIGKTSFLRHVDTLQNVDALKLMVNLTRPSQTSAEPQGQPLNLVLQSVVDQLVAQLTQQALLSTGDQQTAPQLASVLRHLFTQANSRLASGQKLILYFDDLHNLVTADMALVAGLLSSLMPLLDECPGLHLVFTMNHSQLRQIRHPLLDGAPTFNLGPLLLDASINMITLPTKDILRFDYGVTKRIAEINSHHPYYLSLFCHTLLSRHVQDGWVNQRDFDATLAQILDSPIQPFTQIWDKATWPERAVLSGMAAIQGAHGPITGQEILRFLQRHSSEAVDSVVTGSLKTLVERGVLIRMGAISYRFHVEMFRFWLREHTNPAEILAEVNWQQAAKSVAQQEQSARPVLHRPPEARRAPKPRRRWLWPAVIGVVLLCGLLAGGGLLAAQMLNIPIAYLNPPTPTPTPTATPASDQILPLGNTPESVSTEPTLTPTPTPPVVVARTLPSITFMGRDVDQTWKIYVMNADGSDVTPLSPEGGDDTSPVWSPNGQQLAYVSRRDGNREIYLMDSAGQNIVNITRHPADDWTPTWSPDGSRLAFSSFRSGSWEIFVLDTACLEAPETCPNSLTQLTANDNGNLSPVWSPDGGRFAFNSKANGNWDIYTMAADGTDIRQITTDPANDLAPAWSPDGSQLAFESNREGNVEIYVVNAAGGTAANITNFPLADDHGPTWSPAGQQLVFYSNREGNWDIFTTTLDGQTVTNLTQSPGRDEQTPAWRP